MAHREAWPQAPCSGQAPMSCGGSGSLNTFTKCPGNRVRYSFPATEDHPLQPVSPYGVSKAASELYLGYYFTEKKLPYVALRYSNVYGPRQDPAGEAGVVAIFSGGCLAGTPCIIYGDGKQTRDYVYVSDVARANVLALASEYIGPLNI